MVEGRYYPQLAERVLSQPELQPALYGDVDVTATPYRHTTSLADESQLPSALADRAELLADERLVELISTATMLGDVVADPYASLMAERSFKSLIDMLKQACRHGIESVPDAPPELAAFIADMERVPDWVDMELVREGARIDRVPAALASPYVTRGAFLGTFLNTYAALPMALTGALGGKKAARRVNETLTFFMITPLPGALDRRGPGFEAAAMVRLMHSMVRYNALRRSDRWDTSVYGVPVPQIDQVPAGLINIYFIAARARARGRDDFTPEERALVEFCCYRCHLLGLPEELLPRTIDDALKIMYGRAAMIRDDFDDEVCGALVRATMSAYLRPGETPLDRVAEEIERSWSKTFFVYAYTGGDRARAEKMGVTIDLADIARVAATAPLLVGRFAAARIGSQLPIVRDVVDAYVVGLLRQRLAEHGDAEFTTDASKYQPVAAPAGSRA